LRAANPARPGRGEGGRRPARAARHPRLPHPGDRRGRRRLRSRSSGGRLMPIRPPALDDRSFDDLVTDLVRRIPAHTPEWTNPREGDPGRTLIDLFAWLADTILYRANLIPERQRLAFLRVLGVGMRPAVPAHGLVQVSIGDAAVTAPAAL